jgi:D-3-phosphoglycerate dehydrogenase
MTKILIADRLDESVVGELKRLGATVHVNAELQAEDLAGALDDVNILVVRSTRVTADAIDHASSLSLIVRAGAGVNTIDVASASQRGIHVANCPGVNSAAVAELAIGLLIAADRRIVDASIALRNGQWRKKEFQDAHGLKGRTLGILGLGAIGRAVAARAKGLEMLVLAWSRSLTDTAAEAHGVVRAHDPLALAAQSDAVSVHLELTPETHHFVNAQFLNAMRDRAILINTSRGPIVDTRALIGAIRRKKLRVGLDVFEDEPEAGEAPFPSSDLARLVSATPHIAASTAQTSEAIGAEVVRIIANYLKTGHVLGSVNLCQRSPARHRLLVRHFNRVGVLARVLDGLREENINVEEMENMIFEGAQAAVCSLSLDDAPSKRLLNELQGAADILQISLTSE